VQLVGVLAYGAFTFACALAIFAAINATLGLRVFEAEAIEGLDLGEHASHAYDLSGGPG
jgi:Amt family ammonium transporter